MGVKKRPALQIRIVPRHGAHDTNDCIRAAQTAGRGAGSRLLVPSWNTQGFGTDSWNEFAEPDAPRVGAIRHGVENHRHHSAEIEPLPDRAARKVREIRGESRACNRPLEFGALGIAKSRSCTAVFAALRSTWPDSSAATSRG